LSVAIIDYGSGNLHSAAKAFERAARENGLAEPILVTSDPDKVRRAEHLILPGVGAFADCRRGLLAIAGMVEAMAEAVERRGAPFLGICVGMQLLAERGLEHGVTPGLGWIGGEVVPIKPGNPALKIPHMGWNNLGLKRPHALLEGIPTGERGLHAYFVHSYQLQASDPDDIVATTDYGDALTAIVGRDTIVGVQFHPEKSQTMGLRLISNFLRWRP
jgi:glutamine amidotransferase